MICQYCGKEPKLILASHDYDIKYDEVQKKWVKSTGDVVYNCGECHQELSVHDIEDILKQVDEL